MPLKFSKALLTSGKKIRVENGIHTAIKLIEVLWRT